MLEWKSIHESKRGPYMELCEPETESSTDILEIYIQHCKNAAFVHSKANIYIM